MNEDMSFKYHWPPLVPRPDDHPSLPHFVPRLCGSAAAWSADSATGLDQGELVTIPSLPDAADLAGYQTARQKLMPNLSRSVPAARYLA